MTVEHNSSVAVLLWPPYAVCDPTLPRVDLLSYMLDPKKPIEQQYQMCEITNDRIFLDRYHDLERETQDQVRRELQECFAEQGCPRSISVKEWAKQTTERQTPRLRLRCTKVCGFGFQVNFDMDRKQYYVVRSRGKSGNFLHKCPEPLGATTPATPPAMPPTITHQDSGAETPPVQNLGMEPPAVVAAPVSFTQALPNGHPTADAAQMSATLDDFSLLIPQPNASTPAPGHDHFVPPLANNFAAPATTAPVYVPTPAAATAPVYFAPSHFVRDSQAERAQEIHDMDVSSVDSTDMMIARHFGTDHTSSGGSGKLSERMASSGNFGTANSHVNRTQVNNEAEFPTVNSIRSFLSMMTGSINSTLGKSWFARVTGTASGNNNMSSNMDENMQTSTSQAHMQQALSRLQAHEKGDDPMDTMNSALSALSVSGMNTLGTTLEEDVGQGDPAANPFSADFWSPPPSG